MFRNRNETSKHRYTTYFAWLNNFFGGDSRNSSPKKNHRPTEGGDNHYGKYIISKTHYELTATLINM